MRILILVLLAVLVSGCATTPPSKPNDLCEIFREKDDWYPDAKKAQEKWGTSIPVLMSTMYQESSFVHDARPPRRRILGFIPGPRPTNAYGYPQALDDTWDWYRRQTGNRGADRDDFADAMDFMGWYYQESYRRNGIKRDDAYNLYLSYHQGHGGFAKQSYASKGWLKNAAQQVAKRAQVYGTQLKGCVNELEEKASSWF